jgi:NADH-quinone oxidoreductase subunit E
VTYSEFVDNLIETQGSDRSTLIPMLQEVQNEYRYLPEELLIELAHKVNIPTADVYGVATFYSQFRLEPVGEHIIRVCHGTACHVGGAERISSSLEDLLDVKENETTKDGAFTLESVACLGCCSLAPVMMIDERTYGKLKTNTIGKIIKEYHKEEQQ